MKRIRISRWVEVLVALLLGPWEKNCLGTWRFSSVIGASKMANDRRAFALTSQKIEEFSPC